MGRGSETKEPRHPELPGPRSFRGKLLLPGGPCPPPNFQVPLEAHSDGEIALAPGRPVGQSWGQTAKHWLEPVGGGHPVKVHCRRRYREGILDLERSCRVGKGRE